MDDHGSFTQLGNRVIDGFYNTRRIQKRLGYLSPIEFEEKHYASQATAVDAHERLPDRADRSR